MNYDSAHECFQVEIGGKTIPYSVYPIGCRNEPGYAPGNAALQNLPPQSCTYAARAALRGLLVGERREMVLARSSSVGIAAGESHEEFGANDIAHREAQQGVGYRPDKQSVRRGDNNGGRKSPRLVEGNHGWHWRNGGKDPSNRSRLIHGRQRQSSVGCDPLSGVSVPWEKSRIGVGGGLRAFGSFHPVGPKTTATVNEAMRKRASLPRGSWPAFHGQPSGRHGTDAYRGGRA